MNGEALRAGQIVERRCDGDRERGRAESSTCGGAARGVDPRGDLGRVEAEQVAPLDVGDAPFVDETLDDRTVVVVDEAGMADDANLARLVLAVERPGRRSCWSGTTGSSSAVGPGGALAALLERHPDLVVTLGENVRQHDPGERQALAMLRNGDPADAVAWYADQERIQVQPTRVETLVAMADAWATDVDAGHDTALLAWRRQDVTDLNRLARDRWARLGHLDGDDVEVHPGRWYAPGDRLVALAPNPQAGIVTSEPLRVLAVTEGAMTVRTSDDRSVRLEGDALDAERLDHGYALTVHRAQGATYDRAHVLAAGGGRELAYVAISRASDHTTIHATADDIAQAVDDLRADWGVDRAQRWISTTRARPGFEPEPARSTSSRRRYRTGVIRPRNGSTNSKMTTTRCSQAPVAGRTPRPAPRPAASTPLATDCPPHAVSPTIPTLVVATVEQPTKALPQLEIDVEKAQQVWDGVGAPEARRIEADIKATNHDLTDLARAEITARLDSIETRGLNSTVQRTLVRRASGSGGGSSGARRRSC